MSRPTSISESSPNKLFLSARNVWCRFRPSSPAEAVGHSQRGTGRLAGERAEGARQGGGRRVGTGDALRDTVACEDEPQLAERILIEELADEALRPRVALGSGSLRGVVG